jgi:hypothetical protein
MGDPVTIVAEQLSKTPRHPFLLRVLELAEDSTRSRAPLFDHRETCELAAHALLFAAGREPDRTRAYITASAAEPRVAEFKQYVYTSTFTTRAEAEAYYQGLVTAQAYESAERIADAGFFGACARQFVFTVPDAVIALRVLGEIGAGLRETEAFRVILAASHCPAFKCPPVDMLDWTPFAQVLAPLFPVLVTSNVIGADLGRQMVTAGVPEMSSLADQMRVVLTFMCPEVRAPDAVRPSVAAVSTKKMVHKSARVLYAAMVVTAVSLYERPHE